jgi:hypothetical protein
MAQKNFDVKRQLCRGARSRDLANERLISRSDRQHEILALNLALDILSKCDYIDGNI